MIFWIVSKEFKTVPPVSFCVSPNPPTSHNILYPFTGFQLSPESPTKLLPSVIAVSTTLHLSICLTSSKRKPSLSTTHVPPQTPPYFQTAPLAAKKPLVIALSPILLLLSGNLSRSVSDHLPAPLLSNQHWKRISSALPSNDDDHVVKMREV